MIHGIFRSVYITTKTATAAKRVSGCGPATKLLLHTRAIEQFAEAP
jgi:hypothetical protein